MIYDAGMAATVRHRELDLLRTLAVIAMIAYHAAFDLHTFYGWQLDIFSGAWWLLARSTASLFLLLVGASFAISWSRGHRYERYLRRGALLMVCATLVSSVTAIADPETYVRFGILHCIAFAVVLLPFFAYLKEWNVLIGAGLILLGGPVSRLIVESNLWIPLGAWPVDFVSVDYFPILPWLGVPLIGFALGHLLYVRFPRPENGLFSAIPEWLTWPGRRALWIYLLHQPILLGILAFFGFLRLL
jgi:uncharacterized membrane protein